MKHLGEVRAEWQAKAKQAVEAGADALGAEAMAAVMKMESQLRVAERQLEMHLAHAELIEYGISLIG